MGRECPGQTLPSFCEMGVWPCCWGLLPVTDSQSRLPCPSSLHACAVVTGAALKPASLGTNTRSCRRRRNRAGNVRPDPSRRDPTFRSRHCPRGVPATAGLAFPGWRLSGTPRMRQQGADASSVRGGRVRGGTVRPGALGGPLEREGRCQVRQERVGSLCVGGGSAFCGIFRDDPGSPGTREGEVRRDGGDGKNPSLGAHAGTWTFHTPLRS